MSNFPKTWLVALALAGAVACSKSVAVSINIVTVGCPGSPDPFNLDGGAGNSVQYLKFSVTVDGGTVDTQTTAVASQTLQLPTLPLGTATINVEGLAGATTTTPLAVGTSGPFYVPGDGSVSQLSVTVFMRPVNSFSFTNSSSAPGTCTTMVSPRAYHSQALLPDGKVLIFGGLQYGAVPGTPVDWTVALAMPPMVVEGTQYWNTAEIYDPSTGAFTAAGSLLAGNSSVPAFRAFSQIIPYDNGDAVMVGGESADPSGTEPLTIPSLNGAIFSATPSPGSWSTTIREPSMHDHGCLTNSGSGHPLIVGGYQQVSTPPEVNSTNPFGEFFDPTVWPPVPVGVEELNVPPNEVMAESRADQTCSGFDGVQGSFYPALVVEIGGVAMDPAGDSAMIDQDYAVYLFEGASGDGGPNFTPYRSSQPNVFDGGPGNYAFDGGPIVFGLSLSQPRARAKAAAMIVTEPATGGTMLGDAILVTGGLTCTPTGGTIGCTPAFVNDAGAGQLANAPYTYFSNQSPPDGGSFDVGLSTELIDFEGNTVNTGLPMTGMQVERIDHCAVALPDGRVVVIGGLSGSTQATFGTTNSVEVFSDNPLAPNPPTVTTSPVPNGLLAARAGMACTLLQDGSILVTGGFQTTGPLGADPSLPNAQAVTTLNTAEIYRPLPLATADGGV